MAAQILTTEVETYVFAWGVSSLGYLYCGPCIGKTDESLQVGDTLPHYLLHPEWPRHLGTCEDDVCELCGEPITDPSKAKKITACGTTEFMRCKIF